jgi:excisionase family DNA binding protein
MTQQTTDLDVEPIALRINDAARKVGLGRTSIYELIKEGKLKTVKVAGRRLVPMSALRELIDE